jgi:hypothetical protein
MAPTSSDDPASPPIVLKLVDFAVILDQTLSDVSLLQVTVHNFLFVGLSDPHLDQLILTITESKSVTRQLQQQPPNNTTARHNVTYAFTGTATYRTMAPLSMELQSNQVELLSNTEALQTDIQTAFANSTVHVMAVTTATTGSMTTTTTHRATMKRRVMGGAVVGASLLVVLLLAVVVVVQRNRVVAERYFSSSNNVCIIPPIDDEDNEKNDLDEYDYEAQQQQPRRLGIDKSPVHDRLVGMVLGGGGGSSNSTGTGSTSSTLYSSPAPSSSGHEAQQRAIQSSRAAATASYVEDDDENVACTLQIANKWVGSSHPAAAAHDSPMIRPSMSGDSSDSEQQQQHPYTYLNLNMDGSVLATSPRGPVHRTGVPVEVLRYGMSSPPYHDDYNDEEATVRRSGATPTSFSSKLTPMLGGRMSFQEDTDDDEGPALLYTARQGAAARSTTFTSTSTSTTTTTITTPTTAKAETLSQKPQASLRIGGGFDEQKYSGDKKGHEGWQDDNDDPSCGTTVGVAQQQQAPYVMSSPNNKTLASCDDSDDDDPLRQAALTARNGQQRGVLPQQPQHLANMPQASGVVAKNPFLTPFIPSTRATTKQNSNAQQHPLQQDPDVSSQPSDEQSEDADGNDEQDLQGFMALVEKVRAGGGDAAATARRMPDQKNRKKKKKTARPQLNSNDEWATVATTPSPTAALAIAKEVVLRSVTPDEEVLSTYLRERRRAIQDSRK